MAIVHGGDIFAIAREHGWDWREVCDFSASINPLGPSPNVKPAVCHAIDRIVHYPERDSPRLRRGLAQAWGIDEDQLMLGNGATELIFFVSRMFASSPVHLALPVFSEFHRAFPDARTAHLQEPATWPDDGLLMLTRPANPTAWTLPLDMLENWLGSHQNSVLIDESFLDFSGLPSAATLLRRHPQLLILRSLTKFYALPGLRIGALIASPESIRRFEQYREPWQVNILAEEAALAAVSDAAHCAGSRAFVDSERNWLCGEIASTTGASPAESAANFLYVRIPYPASKLCEHMLHYKILIRNCTGWPGLNEEAVRIAVRPRNENELLLKAWRGFECGV